MTKHSVSLCILLIGCVITLEYDWTYRIESFNTTSTNKELLDATIRPIRISPGTYGLSGTIKFGMQMDNSLTLEMSVYRSATGDGNFVITPYRMQKMSLYYFANTIYRQFVMRDILNCSDLPVFKGLFRGPLGPEVYHLDKCFLGTKKLPKLFRTGFYKTIFTAANPLVQLDAQLIAQV